jgi:hypothetical protein
MTKQDEKKLITGDDPMGATLIVGSDAYPYTIVELRSKSLWAKRDSFRMANEGEYFGNQIWDCYENKSSGTELFTLRKNGGWYKKGVSSKGCPLIVGSRRPRQDPHF